MDTSSAIMQVVLQAQDGASSILSGFGNTLNNVMEIAAGFSLANIGAEIVGATEGAVSAVGDFQSYTASLGGLLSNIGDTGSGVADSVAASGGKVSNTTQEIADEMRQYSEKVKQLQDDISTSMQGQNVIDAQTQMYQQLNDLAEQHADKVVSLQQQITDVQTGEANNLTDMQSSHDNKMADMAEKHAQEMADATSQIQKDKLQKAYDEQVQYENDSFERQLTTKKAQLDRDAKQKIDSINQQIAEENEAYTKKYADEQQKDQDNIVKLQEDNAKKLAQYKQELADEEIAHKEHLERIQQQAAGAAAGSGITKLNQLLPTDKFAAQANSLKNELGFLDNLAPKTPFEFSDLVKSDQLFTAIGVNGKKLIPIAGDISAAFGKDLGTGTQAILDGLNGNMRMLQMNFGISTETMKKFNGGMMPTTQEQFLEILEKIRDVKFADGMKDQMDTLNGRTSNLHDNMFRLEASILGFDTATGEVAKGGALDIISTAILNVSNYIEAHKDQIKKFFDDFMSDAKLVGGVVKQGFDMIVTAIQPMVDVLLPKLQDMWNKHHDTIIQVAKVLGGLLVIAIIGVIGIVIALADVIIDGINTVSTWIETGEKWIKNILSVIDHIHSFKDVLNDLGKVGTDIFNALGKSFKDFVNSNFIDGMNTIIKAVDTVSTKLPGGVAIKIPTLNHFASGTDFAPGGLSLVGENGPELVNLPRGSQVIPNSQISNYHSGGNVTIQNVNLNNQMDIDTMMRRITYNMKYNSAI